MTLEVHFTGPAGNRVVAIDGPLGIGRSPENDISLVEDKALSRQHCIIEIEQGHLAIRDLGSRHGLWFRGQRVKNHRINPGDTLYIGHTRMVFLLAGQPTPPPPRPRRRSTRAAPPQRSAPKRPVPKQRQAPASRRSPARNHRQAASSEPAPAAQAVPAPAPSAPAKPKPSSGPKPTLPPEAPEHLVPPLTWAEVKIPKGWPGGTAPKLNNRIQQICLEARRRHASDLHITPHMPLCLRINGTLIREGPDLTVEDTEQLLNELLVEDQREFFKARGDYDFCFSFEGGGRYRANVARQRTGNHITLRVIKEGIKSLTELGLPTVLADLTTYAQGIVLITGPMGAGKTTTMMALVQLVNQNRPDHIITVEDPIEFLMPAAACQVSQRQLGVHTESFDAALRAALREDPDILVIGDLRDYATTSLAISASETGHLVFASMHAMNCVKTLDKLIDMFPAGEQNVIRMSVSESLRGVVSQRLIPAVGGGRVAAVEILFNSVAVANCIRENKASNLIDIMQLGKASGMQTLDMALQGLLDEAKIGPETAFACCDHQERFRHLLPLEAQEEGNG